MKSEEFSNQYEKLSNIHFAFVLKLVKNREEALDLHQESWMKCWKNISSFNGENFRAWLYQITKNIFFDNLKKKRPLILPSENFESLAQLQSTLELVLKSELSNKLKNCLETLTCNQKMVVNMRLEGMDFTEIAREIHVENEGVAYSLHFRAKKNLELCMLGDKS